VRLFSLIVSPPLDETDKNKFKLAIEPRMFFEKSAMRCCPMMKDTALASLIIKEFFSPLSNTTVCLFCQIHILVKSEG